MFLKILFLFLFFTTFFCVYITNFLPKFFSINTLYFPGHNILHMDFHFDDHWVYWVDFEEGKHNGVYRIHPDGTERQHVIMVSLSGTSGCGSGSESRSGSTGSTCFWASWIRIHQSEDGSGSASGSISQRHGSADPDPDWIHPKMSWIRNTAYREPVVADPDPGWVQKS
jgi:hypothetical protein